MPRDWSSEEVEAVVSDYFGMLDLELRGIAYSKADHRRALRQLLDQRSDASVEYKHANISAVLIELGFPYVRGYQPRHNYQRALVDAVASRLLHSRELELVVGALVSEPASAPSVDDILAVMVDAPRSGTVAPLVAREAAAEWRCRRGVDYLKREASNASLGRAGEEFVVNFEVARLLHAGQDRLADRVEHVAVTIGDGLGFDVRSFEAGGSETFIEVKTTSCGILTPFYVSPNELSVSRTCSSQFRLYRLFDFRRDPHLFQLSGAIDQGCNLEPSQYLARVS